MAVTIKHAKTDTIADWTQADLDAQIALGNFPPGTVLADIVLPSDWNNDHTFTGTLPVANGGTGQTSYTNGQLLIGNTTTGGLDKATLTAGAGIGITNNAGSILIANTGGGGGGVSGVTASLPLASSGGSTPNISITQATTSTDGYLSSTDWNTFNGKGSGTVTSITAGTGLSGGTITSSGTIAIDSTVATLTGSQVLTNKTISGATNTLSNIGNSSLTNSAITINGTSTSLGGSISVGTVTSVTGTAPVVSSGGATPAISMAAASSTVNGYLTSTDWNTFNNKGSGTVTSVSATSPVTSTGGATPTIAMPAATTSVSGYLTSTDWTTFNNKGSGTVTSVAALTLGTTGTDLSSSVANSTTTPVITLNVPTASATNRGALSSADWTTFNNKGSGTVTSVSGTGSVNGITLTGTVTSTGSLTLGGTLGSIANSQLTNSSVTVNGTAIALGASGTVTATATNALTIGSGLSGTSYNGSTAVTIANSAPMTYPTSSGIAVVSSGTSWGTTLTAPSGAIVGTTDTQTLTNKRVTPRVSTTTSSATPTINTDNVDFYGLTAQAANITSFTTNLSGTPTDGQKLWIYIVGTAARTITWGASFEASTVALPTTTVTTNRLDVGFVWNAATSKWRCVAVA